MKTRGGTLALKIGSGALNLIPGFLFLILAIIGAVLPVVPTVPFLLLALWFFAKSSDSLSQKIRNAFLTIFHIRNLNLSEGLKCKDKLRILIPVLGLLCVLFFLSDNPTIKTLIVLAAVIKTAVFIKIKTRN